MPDELLMRQKGDKFLHFRFSIDVFDHALSSSSQLVVVYRGLTKALQSLQRRGIGASLVRGVIAHAADHAQIIQAHVTMSNAGARAMYRALGFVAYGVEKKALLIDGVFHDEELIALELPDGFKAGLRRAFAPSPRGLLSCNEDRVGRLRASGARFAHPMDRSEAGDGTPIFR